jgi:hypothetical protein
VHGLGWWDGKFNRGSFIVFKTVYTTIVGLITATVACNLPLFSCTLFCPNLKREGHLNGLLHVLSAQQRIAFASGPLCTHSAHDIDRVQMPLARPESLCRTCLCDNRPGNRPRLRNCCHTQFCYYAWYFSLLVRIVSASQGCLHVLACACMCLRK